jgi:hypothetical protein
MCITQDQANKYNLICNLYKPKIKDIDSPEEALDKSLSALQENTSQASLLQLEIRYRTVLNLPNQIAMQIPKNPSMIIPQLLIQLRIIKDS